MATKTTTKPKKPKSKKPKPVKKTKPKTESYDDLYKKIAHLESKINDLEKTISS